MSSIDQSDVINGSLPDALHRYHGYENRAFGYNMTSGNATFSPDSQGGGESNMAPGLMTCKLYDFLIEAVFMGALCVFGFAGNSLSMMCLLKDKSKTATPFLLCSLEVADTLFLVTVLILRVLTSLHMFTDWFPALVGAFPYLGKYIYPCALMAGTGTVYLTILVTVNRYIMVCRPYEASDLCSMAHARKHVILVVLFSIAYNIPRFFEYVILEVPDGMDPNKTVMALIPSPMEENKIYQVVYKNILYFVVMFLVPLVTLIILNYKLIKALRKTKKKRAQLLHTSDSSSRSEDDITLVLIVVVLVFVVCQTPALVTQVLLSLLNRNQRLCPNAYFFYERFSDLMVVANSSLNFLIYCFCSKKFRQILVLLVCKQKLDSPEPSQVGRTCKNPSPRPITGETRLVIPLDKRETSSAV